MINDDFLGLNNFVWWFGVVENRLDPLELGRCQVRCFGWHSDDINQIPIEKLPWAHPIIPYGVKAVQPPTEGTMVFGFFADGKEGFYPIIMGTVPGIPEEIRQNNMGFTDPYQEVEKSRSSFPRKIARYSMRTNGQGIQYRDANATRYPANLNEPSTSRLARPTRTFGENGEYTGIDPASIANTTIEIQRKTRYANVVTADNKTWDEPYPSFNAMYPFNNVTETESGHAFEMDDTAGFERVQLSHRTGSTIEFLPEGDVKIKSQRSRYDVTMGNENRFVNGSKSETVQSDMYLRINGKLVIQCKDLEIAAENNLKLLGTNVSIQAANKLSLTGLFAAMSGLNTNISAAQNAKMFGGLNAVVSSSKQVTTTGLTNLVSGGSVELQGILFKTDAGVHDFLSPVPTTATVPSNATDISADGTGISLPGELRATNPYAVSPPKTDKYSRIAQTRTSVSNANTVLINAQQIVPKLDGSVSSTYDAETGSIKVNLTIPNPTFPSNTEVFKISQPETINFNFEVPQDSTADKVTNVGEDETNLTSIGGG